MSVQLSRFGGANDSKAVVGACGCGVLLGCPVVGGKPVPPAELTAYSRMVKSAANPLTW